MQRPMHKHGSECHCHKVHANIGPMAAPIQVEEVRNPALREVPLGVTQKYLIVTANYPASGSWYHS